MDDVENIYISPLADVKTKNIGARSKIASFVYIEEDVSIGQDVIIHPHVTIYKGVTLGDGVEIFPGSVLGKEPKGAGALARVPDYDTFIKIGNNCSIGPNSVIFYDVTIGENTLIGDGASIREKTNIGSRVVVGRYVTINYDTTIGDGTKIMDHSWLAGNMSVGINVFISGGVMTTNDNAIGKAGFNATKIKGPVIEDGAAIGANATLLPDITIGKNSIVGSGSIVTKDVAADVLVMGSPARVVRSLQGKIIK